MLSKQSSTREANNRAPAQPERGALESLEVGAQGVSQGDEGGGGADVQDTLVATALAGNGDAFQRLAEPHRAALRAYCYRMLGSLHDAEDAVQETLLRAWRKLATFEGRASFRTWLFRIACRACLDAMAMRRRRVLPSTWGLAADPEAAPAPPLTDGVWLEPIPDALLDAAAGPEAGAPEARYLARESVELAFVALTQTLPPRQRAALILRDVLGWSAVEVAQALETSAASANSLVQRARTAVRERYPVGTRDDLAAPADGGAVVQRYMEAWERADVDGLAALLTEDARMTMPPTPSWYDGRDSIRRYFASRIFGGAQPMRIRLMPMAGANRQPAVAAYIAGPDGVYHALAVKVFTLRGGAISEITGFCDPAVFRAFGLPERLAR